MPEYRSLVQLVELNGPLAVENAVDYIALATDLLAAIHAGGDFHGEISPRTIVLTQQDEIRLLNASPMPEKVQSTADYLAPEQAFAGRTVDERADIYSLGCTLYFLLCGRAPFSEGSLAQRILNHQTASPDPISDGRSDVPEAVLGICNRLMAKRPEDRLQPATTIAAALRNVR